MSETRPSVAAPQPMPTPGAVEIAPLVLADIQERVAAGRVKYGTTLRASNGRDPLADLYQELIDGVMYLRQHMVERAAWRPDPLVVRLALAAADLCDVAAVEGNSQRMWSAAQTTRNALRAYDDAFFSAPESAPEQPEESRP